MPMSKVSPLDDSSRRNCSSSPLSTVFRNTWSESGFRDGRTETVCQNVQLTYFTYARKTKTYALGGVTLHVDPGEFVAMVGPSECGKTTFLNAVDELLPIDDGEIRIDGHSVSGPGRDRAMVFYPEKGRTRYWRQCRGTGNRRRSSPRKQAR